MTDQQYVSLVAQGGTPVRLVNQRGASYPTTGSGALVFDTGPILTNATLITPVVIDPISGVTRFSGGTTGLTPSVPTTGDVTLGGVLIGANGGTGINNAGKTITLGGNFVTSGNYNATLVLTGNTSITLPTSGTLATLGSNTFTGTQIVPAGSLGSPSLQISDAGGFYKYGTNTVGISSLGVKFGAFYNNPTNGYIGLGRTDPTYPIDTTWPSLKTIEDPSDATHVFHLFATMGSNGSTSLGQLTGLYAHLDGDPATITSGVTVSSMHAHRGNSTWQVAGRLNQGTGGLFGMRTIGTAGGPITLGFGSRSEVATEAGSTGTFTSAAYGVSGEVRASGSGVIPLSAGLRSLTTVAAAGTISEAHGINISLGSIAGSMPIYRGLYIDTSVSDNANWWAIYSSSFAKSFIRGPLGVGSGTLTDIQLRATATFTDPSTTKYAAFANLDITLSANNSQSMRSVGSNPSINQAGFDANASNALVGYWSQPLVTGASGTVSGVSAFLADVRNTAAGILTNGIAFNAAAPTNSGGGTYTNWYGFFTGAAAAATNNYGFYGNLTAGTNNWNAYFPGTAKVYIAGSTAIGTSPSSTSAKLLVTENMAGSIATLRNTTNSGSTAVLRLLQDRVASSSFNMLTLETDTLGTPTTVFSVRGDGQSSIRPSTALTSGGSLAMGYVASSTQNFGVFLGVGAPTIVANKGSLYLRTDGSGTTDRLYVATDTSGTWTALVTVA